MDGEISPDELRELLTAEGVRVVDIRDEGSFERGHIPDSENVPFRELPDRIEEFDGADRVVTVCPHGKASVQAARLVGSYEGCAETRVESMAGGLEAWSERYELVDGAADDAAGNEGAADGAAGTESDGSAEADGGTSDAPF